MGQNWNLRRDTAYYLASGTHTIRTGQIIPSTGDTFIGAPGAVLSGGGINQFAFTGTAKTVTIEHLTVTDFTSVETQYMLNSSGAPHWTVKYDTIEKTTVGSALDMGADNVVQYDCITHNAQEGFAAYNTTSNVATVTFSYNEVSYNDGSTGGGGKYTQPGSQYACGCAGGGKFWRDKNVTVTHNYVHNNGNVGIWVDTDNRGFDISDNYISDNYSEGLIYEISYNALISHNTFAGNARGSHDPALYISESGGDSRVSSAYLGELSITGNVFTGNWSGLYLYENADRYCGDSSDGVCTLVTPATYTITSCRAHMTGSKPTQTPDYYDDCRWKTRTVTVTHNQFNFTPSALGSTCTKANLCGFNGLYSDRGTTTPWSGWVVAYQISDRQNDRFFDNSYDGPWSFLAFAQGTEVTWTQWSKGFKNADGSGHAFDAQDAGSTYKRTLAAPHHQDRRAASRPHPPSWRE